MQNRYILFIVLAIIPFTQALAQNVTKDFEWIKNPKIIKYFDRKTHAFPPFMEGAENHSMWVFIQKGMPSSKVRKLKTTLKKIWVAQGENSWATKIDNNTGSVEGPNPMGIALVKNQNMLPSADAEIFKHLPYIVFIFENEVDQLNIIFKKHLHAVTMYLNTEEWIEKKMQWNMVKKTLDGAIKKDIYNPLYPLKEQQSYNKQLDNFFYLCTAVYWKLPDPYSQAKDLDYGVVKRGNQKFTIQTKAELKNKLPTMHSLPLITELFATRPE